METRQWLALGLAVCAVTQVAATFYKSCGCGLNQGGKDVCDHTTVMVKPKPNKFLHSHLKQALCNKLKHIGDDCTCKKFVFPALLPKPPCFMCKKGPPPPPPEDNYVSECSQYQEEPQPDSQYGLVDSPDDQTTLRESYLNYGPLVDPKDVVFAPEATDVQESGLVAFDMEIIEPKPPGFAECGYNTGQEAPEYSAYSDAEYMPEPAEPPEFIEETGCQEDAVPSSPEAVQEPPPPPAYYESYKKAKKKTLTDLLEPLAGIFRKKTAKCSGCG